MGGEHRPSGLIRLAEIPAGESPEDVGLCRCGGSRMLTVVQYCQLEGLKDGEVNCVAV